LSPSLRRGAPAHQDKKEVVTMPNIAAWLDQPEVLNVTGGIAMVIWAAWIVGGIAYLFSCAKDAR
jgi:hypothetical protein